MNVEILKTQYEELFVVLANNWLESPNRRCSPLEPASQHQRARWMAFLAQQLWPFLLPAPFSPTTCQVNMFFPDGKRGEGTSEPIPTLCHQLTMLGSQRDSHIPYICSAQVPLTTKSSVTMGQPMRSREQMKGLKVFGSNPAMTGSV